MQRFVAKSLAVFAASCSSLLAATIAFDASAVQPGPATVDSSATAATVHWKDGSARSWSAEFSLDSTKPRTLAEANESRDWRIFADFAQVLIAVARPLYADDPIGVDLDASLYALDSTTNRPLSFAVLVGSLSPAQDRRQTAHGAGPAWQYPNVTSYFPAQNSQSN